MSLKESYTKEELVASSEGRLHPENFAKLPKHPMLMVDRITHINLTDGVYMKGSVTAELDIHPDLWFFPCHFQNDPVMPGCLGLDALWQLLGFFLCHKGHPGKGRALGVGEVLFNGEVGPKETKITYQLDIRRVIVKSIVVGVADGQVFCNGKTIYKAKSLKTGLLS